MDRCPICRGRFDDEALCQRCGADLTLVMQIRNEVENLTLKALELIENKQFVQAEHTLEQALTLECSNLTKQLIGFARQEFKQSKIFSDTNMKTSFLHLFSKPFRRDH